MGLGIARYRGANTLVSPDMGATELGAPRVEPRGSSKRRRSPAKRVLATNVEYWAAVVLDIVVHPGEACTLLTARARPATERTSSSRSVSGGGLHGLCAETAHLPGPPCLVSAVAEGPAAEGCG